MSGGTAARVGEDSRRRLPAAWSAASQFLRPVRTRLILSAALCSAVLAGGAGVDLGVGTKVIDRVGDSLLPDQWDQPFWHHVTELGQPSFVAFAAVFCAASVVRRDRRTALSCLLIPLLAVIACEIVLKPLVGRQLGGQYSYPSGHVTAAASWMVDLVLVVPRRGRFVASLLVGAGAALVAVAVVADRAHYPSDALAGLALAPAVALAVTALNRPGLSKVARAFVTPTPEPPTTPTENRVPNEE